MTRNRLLVIVGLWALAAACGLVLAAEKTLYRKASPYATILVTENEEGLRTLWFDDNGVRQSVVKVGDPGHVELEYAKVMPAALALVEEPRRVLVVGLGGGTIPNLLHKHWPQTTIDVVDIDPEVVEAAKKFFGFREDAFLHVYVEDGRRYVEKCKEPYDVIFLDAYGPDNIPYDLATKEFLQAVRRAVGARGIVASNVWTSGSNPLYDAMARTYQEVFDDLYAIDVKNRGNRIFLALPREGRVDRDDLARRAARLSKEKQLRFDVGEYVLSGFQHLNVKDPRARVLLDKDKEKEAGSQGATSPGLDPLPEGDVGVAGRYSGDLGIEQDRAVVFADGFESGTQQWDSRNGDIHTTQQAENVHGGKAALEMILPWPRTNQEAGVGLARHFKTGFDVLHLRYYAKFGKDTELYHGGTHNGAAINARAPGVPQAKPGVPADGRGEFTALLDTWRPNDQVPSPGHLAIYCYHPEQVSRWGDQFFPSGRIHPVQRPPETCFGKDFVSRPDFIPERDRWHCYELMVKANTPGQRDGRIAIWVDGVVIGDFPNLRLRDVESLKANVVNLGLYTQNARVRGLCQLWYDDVVAATSYIGPMAGDKKTVASSESPAATKPPPQPAKAPPPVPAYAGKAKQEGRREGEPRPASEAPGKLSVSESGKAVTLDFGNGVTMELALIPAGSFLMGDADGPEDQKPVHRVNITRPFYMGKYEVTQAQWEAAMGPKRNRFGGPESPVDGVSWEDCQAFMKRLDERFAAFGGTFSLPTEAQWEYACRAGTTTRYSFGDAKTDLAQYAWFRDAKRSTRPVGQKKPNAWGLYDMHGNMWEWCADWYDKDYYKQSPADDPPGPSSGIVRILRGGGWNADAMYNTSAYRNRGTPNDRSADEGFRVVYVR